MSTSQFDPRESGPMCNDYVDALVRILLAGHPLHQPPKQSNRYYILRQQCIRVMETFKVAGRKMYGESKLLEHHEVSLPLDEDYDDKSNCWITFNLYVYLKDNNQLWARIGNRSVGFQRNFSEVERQGYLQLKLEYS